MKSDSTTLVAAIFALILTVFVAILPYVPFFPAGEATVGDIMMQLRHKISAHPVDPRLVFVPIDEISIKKIGAWPLPRRYHAIFLQTIAPEKPKVVGWDILFVDPSPSDTAPASPPPATDDSGAGQPQTTTPPPNTPPAAVVPTPDTSNVSPTTAPSSGLPPAPPTSAPNPPESNPTNAPSSGTPMPPPPATHGTGRVNSAALRFYGYSPGTASSPISVADDSSPSASPSPAAPAPTPEAGAAPPSSPTPPAAQPATPAPVSDETTPPLSFNDEALVEGASLFNNMVTGADRDAKGPALTDNDLLPTRPFKHVSGDPSQLMFAKSAELPIPALRQESYFGFVDQDTSGNTRRTMPMVVNIGGKILPSLDLQILLQYWGIDPDNVMVDIGHEIVLPLPDGTQTHIPIDPQGFITINYRALNNEFQGESYYAVIQGLLDQNAGRQSYERSQLPPLRDKIVMVAVNLTGTDMVGTPLENVAPGVITHLNLLNNILQRDFLHQASPWIWLPLYGLFLFASGNLMFRVGIVPLIPIGLIALVLQFIASFTALWLGNIQVPVAGPLLGVLLLGSMVPTRRFWGEEREKIRVRSAMRAYLSEKVMSKVLAHPDNVKLGGVKQEITIMFCDIRGFTKYCDNRDSGEVLQVLNEYMEEMTQVVFKYDGTVDKYIGDCIMAFWNAPDAQPDHAQRAVCCAMEMRYALANFKTKRAGKDTELFECGIGIHTGEALVGNMGSSLKLNYTAMGSTVNLASRLESLTKRLNERILISEDTLKQLQGDFPLTDRGEAVVPGFANPIHVYAVVAEQDLVSALKVGRTLAGQQEYTAEEASEPIWKPAPLPKDADPN